MLEAASLTKTPAAWPLRGVDCLEWINDHPVLRVMPEEVRDLVRDQGQRRTLQVGEPPVGPSAVGFVIKGALAAFDRKDMACVGLHGRGSMFGWEASLASAFHPVRMLPVIDAQWIEVPARPLTELMGSAWIEHVFARHALDCMSRLRAESACNAVHQVPQRTANWIRRLSDVAGPELRTTQAILAQVMGVQRTSVNAAVKALQRDGAVAPFRGRLIVRDPQRLRRFACGC